MARTQTIVVKCDGDGCRTYGEVVSLDLTPEGWYRVLQATAEGKVARDNGFDLCSLACVQRWAKGRRVALGEIGSNLGKRIPCELCGQEISPQGMRKHLDSHGR